MQLLPVDGGPAALRSWPLAARIASSAAVNSPGVGSTPSQFLPIIDKRTLGEIAEVVGEFRVHPRDDRFVRIVAVLAERDLAQQKVANGIEAVGRDQRGRVDDVAHGFRHLLPAVEEKAVDEDALGDREAGRHQKSRPVDRVEAGDILADDVQVRRPEIGALPAIGKPRRCQIVGQCVDPDLHDVSLVARHRDAPVESRARNREVLQAGTDERDDLVASLSRTDEVGMCLVVGEQAFGEL